MSSTTVTDPYLYISEFLSEHIGGPNSAATGDYYAYRLKHELEWIRHDGVPRCEYYCNDVDVPYTYGRPEYARKYFRQSYHPVILAIRSALEKVTQCKMDVCFLNMYLDQRDYLGWHSDDSPEMDPQRPIVTISLGAVRDIQLRPIDDPAGIGKAGWSTHTLGNGSCFIMGAGMQQSHQHRIPKAGNVVGERISLTFRGYGHVA